MPLEKRIWSKCKCGAFTNFGQSCVNCDREVRTPRGEIDLKDLERYVKCEEFLDETTE